MPVVKQEKEISFSDYIREETFKDEPLLEHAPEISLPVDFKPELIDSDHTASESETKVFWNKIRQFFRTGVHPDGENKSVFYPALIAPYLQGQFPKTGYPYYISEDQPDTVVSLSELLESTFNSTFKEKEALILNANLPRLAEYFDQKPDSNESIQDFSPLKEQAISKLLKLDVRGDEGKIFKDQVSKLSIALPAKGKLLSFSAQVPFFLLRNQLKAMSKNRKAFSEEVKMLVSGLEALLTVEAEKGGRKGQGKSLEEDFSFAGAMISFDKLADILPESASEQMPEKRLRRIKEALTILSKSKTILNGSLGKIFTSETLAKEFAISEVLSEADLNVTSGDLFELAINAFESKIRDFVLLIINVRTAELELKNQFDEDIHSSHFAFFNWNNLSEKELSVFPPIFVFERAETILRNELEGFSKLLASNFPVKVLALNQNFGFDEISDHDSVVFKQELAALTIAHRGTYVFQGGTDEPELLSKSMHDGLLSPSPALWHLLVSDFSGEDQNSGILKISTAIESRFFPRIIYDHNLGVQLGSRFDIRCNPQPDQRLTQHSIEIKKGKETDTLNLSFSVADYLIQSPSKARQILVVPAKFYSDDLITLSDYIEKSDRQPIGKVPFIWVVDSDNKLQKAVVPFSWVTDCNERLDFWQFIQELGGVNSFHVERAIEREQVKWSEIKEQEIAELKKEHLAASEKIRTEAAGHAMDKLASVLLDLDNLVSVPSTKLPSAPPRKDEANLPSIVAEEKAPESKPEESFISSDPWVETYRCTTCNDCIDKLPGVFKYNADKQAYIEDASKATFAQLVTVAEKCPAKCIHPGQPQDKNETGLTDLIERAAKLN